MPVDDEIAKVFVSIRSGLARAVAGVVPPKEIEDVVQETYVRACRAQASNKIASPRSFMYRTARNIALNHVNRAETRLTDNFNNAENSGQSTLLELSDDTLDQVCTDEEFSVFCDAVRHLPVQCRRAFVLKKVYGHSQKEIAKIMQLSEKTVEKHVATGMQRCRRYMKLRSGGQRVYEEPENGRCPTPIEQGDGI